MAGWECNKLSVSTYVHATANKHLVIIQKENPVLYVSLRYQSIVSSTLPSLLTKEDRKVVTHTQPPSFPLQHVKLCDLFDLCYGNKNADYHKTVVSC